MNDELHNDTNQDHTQDRNKTGQTDGCPVCKENPCACFNKEDEDEKTPDQTKPPKISWI